MGRCRRRVFLGGLVFCVILAVVAAYPFVVGDQETRALDPVARAAITQQAGYAFVENEGVFTCYASAGPADGPVAVLVHGYTGPLSIWDRNVDALTGAGFRVLRFDLQGRGYSDRPDIDYTSDVFDRQIVQLLDHLQITEPVHLVGISMGGAIVANFTDRHPDRVASLSLFAPAGFHAHEPLRYRALHWPGVGEWLMKMFGDRTLPRALDRMSLPADAPYRSLYLDQMTYRGYKRALLSTLRNFPLMTLEPVYRRVGVLGRPCLLFWGTADHVLPFAHHDLFLKALPQTEFHAVEGGDHTTCCENADEVNPILVVFLKRVAGLG